MEVTESRAEPSCWSPANTEVGQVKAFCYISVVEICQWVYLFRQQPLACFLCPVHLWKLVCSQQNHLGQTDSSGNKARQRARVWVAFSHVFNSPFPGFWVIKQAPFHISKKKALGVSKEEKLGVNTCSSSSWYICEDHVRLPFQCIFYVLKIRQCFDVFNFIKEQGTEKPENSLATAFF